MCFKDTKLDTFFVFTSLKHKKDIKIKTKTKNMKFLFVIFMLVLTFLQFTSVTSKSTKPSFCRPKQPKKCPKPKCPKEQCCTKCCQNKKANQCYNPFLPGTRDTSNTLLTVPKLTPELDNLGGDSDSADLEVGHLERSVILTTTESVVELQTTLRTTTEVATTTLPFLEPKKLGCVLDGTKYRHNDLFKVTSCRICLCNDGVVVCEDVKRVWGFGNFHKKIEKKVFFIF